MLATTAAARAQRNHHRRHVALGCRPAIPAALAGSRLPGQAFLLDSVGCALGGYQQHDVKIALEVLDEIAGHGTATVIGTGKRIDRGFRVTGQRIDDSLHGLQRHLLEAGPVASFGHFSRRDGRLRAREKRWQRADRWPRARARIRNAVLRSGFPGIRERGWHHATLTAFVSPIVAGRVLHLGWEQIQHAVGISAAAAHATLGAVTAGKLTMMKNTVDPMATQSGMLAALLAEKGYTGPEHVVDGKEGLTHASVPGGN